MGHPQREARRLCSSEFGQERPQCDQSALRRLSSAGGAAVGQRGAIATGREE